jgi:electron transport complex protein RnfD
MKFVTSPGPFIRNPLAKTRQAMFEYTIGLLGLFSFSVGFHWLTHGMDYGVKAIGMMLTSLLITLLADIFVGVLKYQYQDGRLLPYIIKFVKGNYSYVTAVLMTLTLPIGTPYFVVIFGNLFATLIVKYAFGGFGANIFNPAAFGRIFVGLAFGSDNLILFDCILLVISSGKWY